MKRNYVSATAIGAALTASLVSGHTLGDDTQPTKSSGGTEIGVVQVPSFEIPQSRYLSTEGKMVATFIQRAQSNPGPAPKSVAEGRAQQDAALLPVLKMMQQTYKVDVVEDNIAGVPVRVVTPAQGIDQRNKDRVLINLHGGAFFRGENVEALVESVPVASVAGMKVITVNYRQGPEYKFPAATVDVVSVYREILKNTKAAARQVDL